MSKPAEKKQKQPEELVKRILVSLAFWLLWGYSNLVFVYIIEFYDINITYPEMKNKILI